MKVFYHTINEQICENAESYPFPKAGIGAARLTAHIDIYNAQRNHGLLPKAIPV